MPKALLTGSHGFVGRHMTRTLRNAGYDVTRVDKRATGVDKYNALRFFQLNDDYYDLAIHAAAHVGGRQDIDGASAFVGAYNVQLDGAFFQWILKAKPRHAIYLSSSAAYPVAFQNDDMWLRLPEDLIDLRAPLLPDQTYGAVKLFGERLAYETQRWIDASGSRQVSIHVVRPFSGYGTDQGLEYPFGAFVSRAISRQDPFYIWGDPTSRRDWVHIDDICAAIMCIVDQDYLLPINLCTGVPTTFIELAKMCTAMAGYLCDFLPLYDRPMGVHSRVGDSTRQDTVYTPRITIDEGVRRAIWRMP